MNDHAVIQATYADWRLVKTRGVVQLIFELPVEKADLAYQVVGGMPNASRENWFAIARLNEKAAADPVKDSPASRSFNELPLPQQAGILCNEPAFHKFLEGFCAEAWADYGHLPDATQIATFCVRRLCNGIASRRELVPGTPEAAKWRELVGFYQAWKREPEVVS